CQTERDQLFECEAPGIGSTCLTPCRVIQSQLNQAGDNPREVEAGASCPLLTDSCEAWCWTLFSFSSDELAALGVPVASTPALSFMPTDVPDSGFTDAGVGRANPLSSCLELLISE